MTIPSNTNTSKLNIKIVNDCDNESNEIFYVEMQTLIKEDDYNSNLLEVGDNRTANITIIDDDGYSE